MADGKTKQPYFVSAKDGNPLSFAGIWDTATAVGGETIESCSIITTDCNALMQPIHDRMPVIVAIEAWSTWLNPSSQPDEFLLPILKPFDPDQMRVWPVSPAVGRVAISGGGIVQPLSVIPEQARKEQAEWAKRVATTEGDFRFRVSKVARDFQRLKKLCPRGHAFAEVAPGACFEMIIASLGKGVKLTLSNRKRSAGAENRTFHTNIRIRFGTTTACY